MLFSLTGFAQEYTADVVPDEKTLGAELPDAGPSVDGASASARIEEFPPQDVQDPDVARVLADKTKRSPPVVVVSGGISLGAYQAGFISTLVRFWSLARQKGADAQLGDPSPRVWTGASAGAVNALLGGLASCDEAFAQPRWSPEESLFWEIWIKRLDLDGLLPLEDPARTDHLFSGSYMRETLQRIQVKAKETEFRKDCTFAFGVTVTNLSGRAVPFGEGGPESRAHLTRVTEKLAVQVMTHGRGKLAARLPFLQGAKSATWPFIAVDVDEQRYYPALGTRPREDGGQEVSVENLLLAPQASGSFPFAFPPVKLNASFFNEENWEDPDSLKLVDGGFLNNNPLDLAVRLGMRWNEKESHSRADPSEKQRFVFDSSRFPIVYMDQDFASLRLRKPWHRKPESNSPLAETYFQYAGNLMSGAQDSVVLDTLEHEPKLSGRIKIPRRTSVLPSEFRFAMMGFFDRRFREHDFFRGMSDAIWFLATQFSTTRAVELLVPPIENESLQDRADRVAEVLDVSSPGFRCVVYGACRGTEELVELGRLRTAAKELSRAALLRKLEEDDVDALLKALGEAHYRYSSGVFNGAVATGTRNDLMPVRERLGHAFHDMVSKQQGGMRVVMRPVGAAFLDEWLTYTHPTGAITLQLSRQRGLGLGWEEPLAAFEDGRESGAYNRSEWRMGVWASAFGVRDMDQIVPNETRVRWFSLGGYVDWVSDLDGFDGELSWLDRGPYLRWRAGAGFSGSYLSSPHEAALQLPELRLGLDLMEMVGLRLTVPVALFKQHDRTLSAGWPKVFKESSLGVEVLITLW
ncbi:patatin-like phospholipase family protein [Pyxidicoccus sp. MSG2]|uniref:patatin-like phospholipase family protein n=1 Tax=Pyxidicoccus sp. MSG2 TaxID=2996790 RepID=UPI00226DA617|nr:patatin-like phospholipase family protein [Pyxidicoccus sp. MSG2]MCY1023195.1 patatin-like phospholipase family protein [Pyxidicoccus sp. MSG2]